MDGVLDLLAGKLAGAIIRAQWSIEGLHCAKHPTGLEGCQVMRKDNGPCNMRALRSLAVSLAHLPGCKCVLDAIPKLRKQVFSPLKYRKQPNNLTTI